MKIHFLTNKARLTKIGLVLLVTSGIPIAYGADLTVTKTFSSGETLTASDLNTSFDEVETAVNDNNSRITTLEAISGSTSYLAIPARGGFVPHSDNGSFANCFPNTFAWSGAGSDTFYATVNLPHNSIVTGFTYHFWRFGAPAQETVATLYRQPVPAISSREEIGAYTSVNTDNDHTSGSAPTITNATIDNLSFTYYIEVVLPVAGSLCADGATIEYTLP